MFSYPVSTIGRSSLILSTILWGEQVQWTGVLVSMWLEASHRHISTIAASTHFLVARSSYIASLQQNVIKPSHHSTAPSAYQYAIASSYHDT